jgi:ABC-type branched-subunit amino acid transport system permease subunit
MSHLTSSSGLPWPVAVAVAMLIAIPVGALLAIPAVRLSGLFLALATLGFGLLMQQLFFRQGYMFGAGAATLPTPRPSFATSDRGYYYFVLAIALLVAALIALLSRSRLGRLLRAMADSPTALATHGMSVTVLSVFAFCGSAALAALAGALLGPVSGQVSPGDFATFTSLQLVVILALNRPLGQIAGAFGAAAALHVLPSYASGSSDYFPIVFAVLAIAAALSQAGGADHAGAFHRLRALAERRLERSPVRWRIEVVGGLRPEGRQPWTTAPASSSET